jgi:nitrogen fixation protein NifB
MPLIAEAEHGTFYGIMGQRSPKPAELKALQDACEGDMNMMRHCRQCRADAVGLLGEDRGDEFTMEKIEAMEIDYEAAMVKRAELRAQISAELEAKRAKAHAPTPPASQVITLHRRAAEKPVGRPVLMAVAARGAVINIHFGHAKEFMVYEATANGARFVGHRKADAYCSGDESCGDDGMDNESVLDRTIRALEDCEVVLCSKIGFEPWGALEAAGIKPNGEHAMEPIEEAVMAVWNEMLATGKLDAPLAAQKRA